MSFHFTLFLNICQAVPRHFQTLYPCLILYALHYPPSLLPTPPPLSPNTANPLPQQAQCLVSLFVRSVRVKGRSVRWPSGERTAKPTRNLWRYYTENEHICRGIYFISNLLFWRRGNKNTGGPVWRSDITIFLTLTHFSLSATPIKIMILLPAR